MKAGFYGMYRDNDKMKNDKRRAQGESEAGDFVWIICGGGFRWSIAAVIAAGIAAGPLARVRA